MLVLTYNTILILYFYVHHGYIRRRMYRYSQRYSNVCIYFSFSLLWHFQSYLYVTLHIFPLPPVVGTGENRGGGDRVSTRAWSRLSLFPAFCQSYLLLTTFPCLLLLFFPPILSVSLPPLFSAWVFLHERFQSLSNPKKEFWGTKELFLD